MWSQLFRRRGKDGLARASLTVTSALFKFGNDGATGRGTKRDREDGDRDELAKDAVMRYRCTSQMLIPAFVRIRRMLLGARTCELLLSGRVILKYTR